MRKYFLAFFLSFSLCIANGLTIYANDEIYLGGDSIGIEITYDGVMVSGTYRFRINDTTYDPSNVFQSGDIIQEVNGIRIHSLDELFKQIRIAYKNGDTTVSFRYIRDGKLQKGSIPIVYDDASNAYKTGLYVKDKITGVGTLTFYDPTNQSYGALGHEIYDADSKQVVNGRKGNIYPATITSIQKAQSNLPGEKHASIQYEQALGTITNNSAFGIYGNYHGLKNNAIPMQWAKQEEIKLGKATIYTVVKGKEIEPFTIEITKLHKQEEADIKGIEFRVNDERLQTISNGIVQGMSGSPIVQNNKIIGAVTHVVTNDSLQGYGLYIEFMLNASRMKQ